MFYFKHRDFIVFFSYSVTHTISSRYKKQVNDFVDIKYAHYRILPCISYPFTLNTLKSCKSIRYVFVVNNKFTLNTPKNDVFLPSNPQPIGFRGNLLVKLYANALIINHLHQLK